MNIKRKSRKRVTAFFWIMVILWAAVIYMFSAQSGSESAETSARLIRWVLVHFKEGFLERTDAEQALLIDKCQYLVRKGAHFTEYAVFGALLTGLVFCYGRHWVGRVALLLGMVYAASDELHQLLGGTRSGMWQDVALDSAGVLAGVVAARIMLRFVKKYGRKKRKKLKKRH